MIRLIQDVRYALRTLRRSPGFLVAALLTLSVAIGANTAIFSVVKAVLLEPFAYQDPERILLVWSADARTHIGRGQISASEMEDVKRQNTTLENLAVFADWTPTLSGAGDAERIPATQVGDGFFSVLGTQPLLGRFFTPDEQTDGKDNVVVLSYQLWQNRFAGDPAIVGKTLTLSTVPHIVVGVLPANFRPLPSSLVDGGQLYRPVAEPYDPTKRGERHLRAIAKLKPGVPLASARAELLQISERLAQVDPRENTNIRYSAVSLQEDSVGRLRTTLYVLSGSVLLLLLIACANVANLLLARSTARQREFAVRTALGASRTRLVMQMLTESLLLAFGAGMIGLFLAQWGTRILALFGSAVNSQLGLAGVDPGVIAFCLCATLLTGLVFGLAPALHLSRVSLLEALKSSGPHGSTGRSALRSGLIIAEVAMAVIMLVGAGLLVRSFQRLLNVDVGFDPKGRVASNVWLPYRKYKDPAKQIAFYGEFLERIRHVPGVKNAGLVSNPPMGNFDGRVFRAEGENVPESSLPEAQLYLVTPDYLKAMGIPQLTGRGFTDADHETAPAVILINKKMADARFPGQDPIGKKIQIQSGAKPNGQYIWRTIVGVVADVKQHGLDLPAVEEMYVPFVQMPVSWMTLVMNVDGDPTSVIAPMRSIVKELDPDVAPFAVSTYDQMLGKTISTRRFALLLVSGFGVAALLLGVIGIYGVISYSVTQRTQEIGIRMALGAQRGNILRAVLWEGLRYTLAGVAIGIGGALATTRLLQSLLYEVRPTDLTTFVAIAGLICGSALLASLIPARRATTVDPMVALRYE